MAFLVDLGPPKGSKETPTAPLRPPRGLRRRPQESAWPDLHKQKGFTKFALARFCALLPRSPVAEFAPTPRTMSSHIILPLPLAHSPAQYQPPPPCVPRRQLRQQQPPKGAHYFPGSAHYFPVAPHGGLKIGSSQPCFGSMCLPQKISAPLNPNAECLSETHDLGESCVLREI